MMRRKIRDLSLAFAVAALATSAFADTKAMIVTSADYDIFVYPNGDTFVRVPTGLASRMPDPQLNCNVSDDDLFIRADSDRFLVPIYTGRSINATMQFGVSDDNVPANGTCEASYVILLPAS